MHYAYRALFIYAPRLRATEVKYMQKNSNGMDVEAQDNVMPGIEALPLYISNCVGGMLVVANPEYEDRAWCRLEQVDPHPCRNQFHESSS
jgi:hypothetical protein